MPRYFIDTYDGFVAMDGDGHELPDMQAVRTIVRKTLTAMMQGEKNGRAAMQLRADVRTEAGDRVMTATLLLVTEELSTRAADGPP